MAAVAAASERPPPFASRLNGRAFLFYALLLLVAFLVLTPIVLIFFNSFYEAETIGARAQFSLEGWKAAFTSPGIRQSLINTLTLTITRQAIAVAVAIIFVWLITRTDLPGRRWLEFGFWMVFFMPTLPVLLGWVLLLHPSYGYLNELAMRLPFVNGPLFNIYSWWGIVWVHLLTGSIAIKVVLLAPAFRNMDSALEEASRISGASVFSTVWRVVVPIMLPAILVVTLMSAVISLQAFEIELALGGRAGVDVFSTMIWKFVKLDPAYPGRAAALSILILAVMIPFVLLQYRFIGRRNYATVTGRYQVNRTRLGGWRWPTFGVVMFFIAMATVLPLAFLITGTFMKLFGFFGLPNGTFTLHHWDRVLTDPIFIGSMRNTLVLGGSAALLAAVWFSLVAYVVVRTRFRFRMTLDFISWLPWALPGVLLGLGMLWMVISIPIFRPLHTSTFVLVIAVTLGAITVGVQMFRATFLQIGADVEEAARISGGSWLYAYRRVLLPIMAPTIVAVAMVTFVSAVRDISRIVLLAGSANRPLSLLQLDLIRDESLEAAAVVGVIITILTVVVAVIAQLVAQRVTIQGR
ncbi:MAG: iron ABC transporter permease [Dehalococcoidia bacterium]|nr:iron ABC transporter permease [Dehalococcoidia bacterium]